MAKKVVLTAATVGWVAGAHYFVATSQALRVAWVRPGAGALHSALSGTVGTVPSALPS